MSYNRVEKVLPPLYDVLGSWSMEAVFRLKKEGIVSGYSDGSFRPNATVTKEEFIKMLVMAKPVQEKTTSSNSFSDVTSSRWSYGVIQKESLMLKQKVENLILLHQLLESKRQCTLLKL